jgi:hypothetical protein
MLARVASSLTRARLAGAAAIACAAALVSATGGAPAAGSRQMLPDLVAHEPAELSLRAVRRDGDVRYLLGFRSAASNLGRGPLIVDAERDLRRPLELAATQVIHRVSGPAERRPLGTALTYVVSSDHSHWHYPAFMRYELRRPGRTGARVGRDHKTGFCLGDRYDAHPLRRLPGKPAVPRFTTACGKNRPNLARLREGISVGYGDDYAPLLEGQAIDVTELSPGRYRLVHTVNPDRSLAERSYRNNVSSIALRIGRDDAGRPNPGVRMSP